MIWIILLFIFVFGCIIGSFVNVVALRLNTGISITTGRSRCMSCNLVLRWYELFPLFSFLFLRGKCGRCRTPISFQYPAIEALSGFLFVGLFLRQWYLWPIYSAYDNGFLYSALFFFFYALVFSVLLAIIIYDIRHKIIPNKLVYLFIFLSLIKMFVYIWSKDFLVGAEDVYNILAPLFLFFPFWFLWFVSNGKWIGFGDAKLVIGIGAMLGFVSGINAVVLAFWLGALWSMYVISHARLKGLHKKYKLHMKTEVPFAPFLVLATIIIFFTRLDLVNIKQFFDVLG